MAFRRCLSRFAVILGIASVAAAYPLRAQDTMLPSEEVPILRSVAASIGLGTAGFLGGGILGALAGSGCSGEDCEIESVILYGMVGITAGSALGVHLGNRRRGSFPLDVLASAGAMLGGLLFANLVVEDDGSPILLLAPVAQVIAAVTVERKTGRMRSRGVRVAVGPVGREIGLVIRVTS